MRYSFILMVGQLMNATMSFIWHSGEGTYIIAGAILFVGYCIVRVMENRK